MFYYSSLTIQFDYYLFVEKSTLDVCYEDSLLAMGSFLINDSDNFLLENALANIKKFVTGISVLSECLCDDVHIPFEKLNNA